MAGKVDIQLTMEEHKAFQGFMRLVEGQNKLGAETRRTTGETKKQEDAVWGLVRAGTQWLAGLVSVGAAVTAIRSGLEQVEQVQSRIAQKLREDAPNYMSFAMQQPKGQVDVNLQAAARMGADFGVFPKQSIDLFNALQPLYGGDFAKTAQTAKLAFQGIEAGVPAENARDLISTMIKMGQPEFLGTYLPFAAGLKSNRDPATMAKAGIAVPQLGDPFLAFGAAAVSDLASLYGEEYPTYLRGAGVELNRVTGEQAKTFKRLGVAGGTPLERLRALRGAGIDTARELAGAGFTEVRGQAGLESLIRSLPEIEAFMAEMRTEASPEVAGRHVEQVKKESDIIGPASAANAARARLEVEDYLRPSRGGRRLLMDQMKTELAQGLAERDIDFFGTTPEDIGWTRRQILGGTRMGAEAEQRRLGRLYERGMASDAEASRYVAGLRSEAWGAINELPAGERRALRNQLPTAGQISGIARDKEEPGPIVAKLEELIAAVRERDRVTTDKQGE